jgi:hypothetical protein
MPATINGTSGFGGNLTGNVTGNADTSTSSTTATKLSTTTGDAPTYACRAWVNFNGTTVTNVGGENLCTIRASGNVTKVVRNNTGDYTITFATAMPDANYATVASGSPDVTSALIEAESASTTTTQRVYAKNGTNNASANFTRINVAIFR